jgi:SAM-dependent methyltransferase
MRGPEYEWDPERYRELMAEEVPDYARLQDEVVAAATEGLVATILDLGVGSGLTARRIAGALPDAELVGLDASEAMLAAAARTLDPDRTRLLRQRLEDRLPAGPFDLVVSMLAVHHLDAPGKADLLRRIHGVLTPGADSCSAIFSSPMIPPTASPRSTASSTPPTLSPTTDAGSRTPASPAPSAGSIETLPFSPLTYRGRIRASQRHLPGHPPRHRV